MATEVRRVIAPLRILVAVAAILVTIAGTQLFALADQTGTARMNLRLHSDGRYDADFLVRDVDPALRAQLVAAGFRPAGPGLGMQASGRF